MFSKLIQDISFYLLMLILTNSRMAKRKMKNKIKVKENNKNKYQQTLQMNLSNKYLINVIKTAI